MHFQPVGIISSWKEARPYIYKNMNSFHSRMVCVSYDWNWRSGSGEEKFQKVTYISIIFLFENRLAINLKKIQKNLVTFWTYFWVNFGLSNSYFCGSTPPPQSVEIMHGVLLGKIRKQVDLVDSPFSCTRVCFKTISGI